MTRIVAPKSLSTSQKRAFGKLVGQLAERGVDAAQRIDLVADYIRLADRLDELRQQEIAASGPERLAVTRAIAVGVAERRRLHAQVWAGARATAPIPTVAEAAAATVQNEADLAWRTFLRGGCNAAWAHLPPAEAAAARKAHEAALEKRFGEPSWAALLDDASANFIAANGEDESWADSDDLGSAPRASHRGRGRG